MDLTRLEEILIGLAIVEAIVLVVLWIKKNASGNAVVLEPGEDRLRVDYYWLPEELIPKEPVDPDTFDFSRLTGQLFKTDETFIYRVEDIQKLVSKEKSIIESFRNATVDDPGTSTNKVGAIKPPHGIRKPPGNASLMAIEIFVENRGMDNKQ